MKAVKSWCDTAVIFLHPLTCLDAPYTAQTPGSFFFTVTRKYFHSKDLFPCNTKGNKVTYGTTPMPFVRTIWRVLFFERCQAACHFLVLKLFVFSETNEQTLNSTKYWFANKIDFAVQSLHFWNKWANSGLKYKLESRMHCCACNFLLYITHSFGLTTWTARISCFCERKVGLCYQNRYLFS